MTSTPRETYITLWDHLRSQEEQAIAALTKARTHAVTAHDRDVQEVATALRLGDAGPDIGTNEANALEATQRFELLVKGAKLALSNVEVEIRASVQKELQVDVPAQQFDVAPTEPGKRPAGGVLWGACEEAVERYINKVRAGRERVAEHQRYDAAIEAINAAKFEHARRGLPENSFNAAEYVDAQTLADTNPNSMLSQGALA
jgi:hypothetical protein